MKRELYIASSPSDFAKSANIVAYEWIKEGTEPVIISSRGLRIVAVIHTVKGSIIILRFNYR